MPQLNNQSQIGSVPQAGSLAKIPENIGQLNITLPSAWLAQFGIEMSEALVSRVMMQQIMTQPMFKRFNLARVKEKENGDYIVILQGNCFVSNWTMLDMTITDLIAPLPPA